MLAKVKGVKSQQIDREFKKIYLYNSNVPKLMEEILLIEYLNSLQQK